MRCPAWPPYHDDTINGTGRRSLPFSASVPNASLTKAGKVQLSSDTDSDSETLAATPKAVKTVATLAASKVSPEDLGEAAYLPVNVPNGVPTLDYTGHLTEDQLPEYISYFRGTYESEAALRAAWPSASPGDYANVLIAGSSPAQYSRWVWESSLETPDWVDTGTTGGSVESVNGESGDVVITLQKLGASPYGSSFVAAADATAAQALLPTASLTARGGTTLSSDTDSDSEAQAATPKAVKTVATAASAAQAAATAAQTTAASKLSAVAVDPDQFQGDGTAGNPLTALSSSTTRPGIVQLSTDVTSTSDAQAAAISAVRSTYNLAQSTATALALKAPLASPTFTGTVTVPTVADLSDNSGKAASTSFIQSLLAGYSTGGPEIVATTRYVYVEQTGSDTDGAANGGTASHPFRYHTTAFQWALQNLYPVTGATVVIKIGAGTWGSSEITMGATPGSGEWAFEGSGSDITTVGAFFFNGNGPLSVKFSRFTVVGPANTALFRSNTGQRLILNEDIVFGPSTTALVAYNDGVILCNSPLKFATSLPVNYVVNASGASQVIFASAATLDFASLSGTMLAVWMVSGNAKLHLACELVNYSGVAGRSWSITGCADFYAAGRLAAKLPGTTAAITSDAARKA